MADHSHKAEHRASSRACLSPQSEATPAFEDKTGSDSVTLDWLIIGGGIHGVHIAARLLAEADVDPDRLRIIDPANQLLSRWRDCTATTGMTHLRSPSVHHLDVNPWSLQRFAGKVKKRRAGLFASPYNRPKLTLFDAHCDKLIKKHELAALHIRARAQKCVVSCDEVMVQLADGRELAARNVLLAVGASEQPAWPSWAPQTHERVRHVFEPAFDGWPTVKESVVVVGGGISAGQVALRLLEEGHQVCLLSRHKLRQHQFDSDTGWLGPKLMASFSRVTNFDKRRTLISKARHRGSVSPDIYRALRRAIANGELTTSQSEVRSLQTSSDEVELDLVSGNTLKAQRVLLATGFTSQRPGGALVDELIDSAALPCAECGYPIVDAALRWHPRVFVTGPLAELELGPVARNIAGARRAGSRLVEAIRLLRRAS